MSSQNKSHNLGWKAILFRLDHTVEVNFSKLHFWGGYFHVSFVHLLVLHLNLQNTVSSNVLNYQLDLIFFLLCHIPPEYYQTACRQSKANVTKHQYSREPSRVSDGAIRMYFVGSWGLHLRALSNWDWTLLHSEVSLDKEMFYKQNVFPSELMLSQKNWFAGISGKQQGSYLLMNNLIFLREVFLVKTTKACWHRLPALSP